MKHPTFIAEVKTKSPFGYSSQRSWQELFNIATAHGDIVSVHTDERWGGSLALLKKARSLTSKPLLAKGIHPSDEDIEMALQAGADYVLVVGRLPKPALRKHCLIEPNDLTQLENFVTVLNAHQKIVWNSRNLLDGSTRDANEFNKARQLWAGWLCQASKIRSISDVNPSASAILVGQDLPGFIDSLKTNWFKNN